MNKILDIGFRIKKINDLLCKKADESMQAMGVTYSQHHVLAYLSQQVDYTASLKQMEHEFRVSQATMAGIAIRMEEKDVITSFTPENDRRKKLVRLTDRGVKICEESRKKMKDAENEMRQLFTEEEMKQFDMYLDRLFHALDTGGNK